MLLLLFENYCPFSFSQQQNILDLYPYNSAFNLPLCILYFSSCFVMQPVSKPLLHINNLQILPSGTVMSNKRMRNIKFKRWPVQGLLYLPQIAVVLVEVPIFYSGENIGTLPVFLLLICNSSILPKSCQYHNI